MQLQSSRMACLHFVSSFARDDERSYFLWHGDPEVGSDECPEGVEVDASGRIPTFSDAAEYHAYAAAHGYSLVDERILHYDLDALRTWCETPDAATLSPEPFLDAWDLFADLPGPQELKNLFDAIDGPRAALWDKLFFSSSRSYATPESRKYIPVWTSEDLRDLSHTLRLGLATFEGRLPDRAA